MDSEGNYSGFTSLREKDQLQDSMGAWKKQASSLSDAFSEITKQNNNSTSTFAKLEQETKNQTNVINSLFRGVQSSTEQNKELLELTKTGNKALLQSILKITGQIARQTSGSGGGGSSLFDNFGFGEKSNRFGKVGRVLRGASRVLGPAFAVAGGIGSLNQLGETRGTNFFGDKNTGLLGSRAAGYAGAALSGAEIGGAVGGLFGGVGAVPGAAVGGALGLGGAAIQDYMPQIKTAGSNLAGAYSDMGKNAWAAIEDSTSKGIKLIQDGIAHQAKSSVLGSMTSVATAFVDKLTSETKELLSGLYEWILSNIPSISDIKKGITTTAGNIGGAVSGAVSGAAGAVGRMASGARNAVGGAIDRMTGNDRPEISGYTSGENARTRSGGLAPDEIKRREQQSMEYFMKQGWTKEQAAGITANIKKESGFNEKSVGDGGQAYGLAQWHPDRQGTFNKWSGKDIKGSSYAEQLAHVQYELTHGEKAAGDRLKRTTTAQEAGAAVSSGYERPADRQGNEAERGASAEQYAKNFKPSEEKTADNKPASGTPASNNPADTTAMATKASNEITGGFSTATPANSNEAKVVNPVGAAAASNIAGNMPEDNSGRTNPNMASENARINPQVANLDKSTKNYMDQAQAVKAQVAEAKSRGYSDEKIAKLLGPGFDKDGNKTDDKFSSDPLFKSSIDRINNPNYAKTETPAGVAKPEEKTLPATAANTPKPDENKPDLNKPNSNDNTVTQNSAAASSPSSSSGSGGMARENVGVNPDVANLDKKTASHLAEAQNLRAKVAEAKAKGYSDEKIAGLLGPGYDKDGNETTANKNANDPLYKASLDRVNNPNYAKATPPANSIGTSMDADKSTAGASGDNDTSNNAAKANQPIPKKITAAANSNSANRMASNTNTSGGSNNGAGLGINDIPMHISTGGLLLVNSGATA